MGDWAKATLFLAAGITLLVAAGFVWEAADGGLRNVAGAFGIGGWLAGGVGVVRIGHLLRKPPAT